ncbi:MAG: bifunctional oligoribonuclease/PAP phosphatase NrnA [Candidatus Omnitrophica bacterium]|nr:bifunctional oligoribonuclease/PAP phosphatase NrnA [Candidatus Omnitrophota bacterium]
MTDIALPQGWYLLADLIHAKNRFLISSHLRPDGDAVGSSLAMKRILQRMGKDAVWVMDGEAGWNFDRFYDKEELTLYDPEKSDFSDREVIVMVDAGEWPRLGRVGEAMKRHPGDKICIDHHIPHNSYEGLRIVDAASPSTTVLIYRFIQFLDMEFDLSLAEPVYLGLIVDTQNFHLPNTTEEAHLIAAHCLRAGVQPHRVYEPIFGTTLFSRMRLMSEAFKTFEIACDGKVGVMYTTCDMFQQAEADPIDDDGFIDFVRSVEGVRIGVYLREENEGVVKVSWRAKGDNNVVASAHKFGGGGHLRAAGATILGSLAEVKQLVLQDLKDLAAMGKII